MFQLILILFFSLIFSTLSCPCDIRVGFGNICGHRLGSKAEGCNPNSLYLCPPRGPGIGPGVGPGVTFGPTGFGPGVGVPAVGVQGIGVQGVGSPGVGGPAIGGGQNPNVNHNTDFVPGYMPGYMPGFTTPGPGVGPGINAGQGPGPTVALLTSAPIAQETKDCLADGKICIFGWVLDNNSPQDDQCIRSFYNRTQNFQNFQNVVISSSTK